MTSALFDEVTLRAGLTNPVSKSEMIVPQDGNDIGFVTRSIYVGSSGDLRITLFGDGSTVTLKNVSAGSWYPLMVTRVHATGTTAADLVGWR